MSDLSPADWVRKRDEVLKRGDMREVEAWLRASGHTPSSPGVVEAAYHKAVTAAETLPMEFRVRSWWWLHERGLRTLDDGDVTAAAMDRVQR